MVKKKKVAIVIGRYYLTLPIIIGYDDLYDWEISVIDLGFDPTGVSANEFYQLLPSSISKVVSSCKTINTLLSTETYPAV